MKMERTAKAQWKGGIKDGKGTVSTPSGVMNDSPYSYLTRFEQAKGTNPEELIGAAHASCFAMMTTLLLSLEGHTADRLDTRATVVLGDVDGLPTITAVRLWIHGAVPGIDEATFKKIATDAKAGCPVSRLLNAKIDLEVSFG